MSDDTARLRHKLDCLLAAIMEQPDDVKLAILRRAKELEQSE